MIPRNRHVKLTEKWCQQGAAIWHKEYSYLAPSVQHRNTDSAA